MPSSLAAQLAQTSSLNSSLLVDRSRRTPTESYLFTGREADQHDLDSLHALASNAFLQLRQLNPSFRAYYDALFSDAARSIDRTLLGGDEAKELNGSIAGFLPLLGPWLMEAPTGKVLEWLVRRFRINEFNVEDLLRLFLPYHDSPHFTKMVTILHIRPNSTFSFLNAYKSAAQHLPRAALIKEMHQNVDVARFVSSLLPTAIEHSYVHRTLVAFYVGTMLDFVGKGKKLDDSVLAFLLPAMLLPLQAEGKSNKELTLAAYVLLSALSQKCRLSPQALKTIITTMASSSSQVAPQQYIKAVLSVLSPQEQLEKLPKTFFSSIIEMRDAETVLLQALTLAGSDQLVVTLLPEFVQRIEEDRPLVILNALVTASSPSIPSSVLCQLTILLIHHARSAVPSSSKSRARAFLLSVRQRHPHAFEDAVQTTIKEDDSVKEEVERLILELAVTTTSPSTGKKQDVDVVVASNDADGSVRAAAVRDMLSALEKGGIDGDELSSIHSALLSRTIDTDVQVINTLYSQPALITPILLSHSDTYITALSSSLVRTSTPSRQLIRIHLTFLVHHFTKHPDVTNGVEGDRLPKKIFEELVWPFLLWSKPRQKTAAVVWEILGSEEALAGPIKGLAGYELLTGCVDALKWEEQGAAGDSYEIASRVNHAIANRMAETALMSNRHKDYFEFILSTLRPSESGNGNGHASGLGYLVMRALLGRMSGEHQVGAAWSVLEAMGLKSLDGVDGFMKGAESLQEFLNDASLGMNLVVKPSSKNTACWLQTSLLALMPIIPRPVNVQLDWLAPHSALTEADQRSTLYVKLQRAIYTIANSGSSTPSSPILPASLTRAQFINLSSDAFAFLAGVWLSPSTPVEARRTALTHAAAFLAAHDSVKSDGAIDFQTILPAIIVALQDEDAGVREGAAECLTLLGRLVGRKSATGVYGFDTIYGKGSDQLQYLEWADLQRYVKAMAENAHHCASAGDGSFIRLWHHQHLSKAKGDSKKDTAYKQRVLCYLLSHVNGSVVINLKLCILRSIDEISNRVKAHTLLSTLTSLAHEESSRELEALFGEKEFVEFETLALRSLDISIIADLNSEEFGLWDVFVELAMKYMRPDSHSSPRAALLYSLENGVFKGLSPERKFMLSRLLLDVGSQATSLQSTCKATLTKALDDVPLLIQLATSLQPETPDPAQRANKRTKTSQTNSDSLAVLSFFAEIIAGKTLPGSLDLISCLLDTLGKIVHCDSASHSEAVYIKQLIMSAVESAATNITDMNNMPQNAIRLDILVEIIRVGDNPQTFNQALLLMSELARLTPASVIHNIMPIFTFMGSNVFHRDDSYSFHVVQQTVECIVPVMVAWLETKYTTQQELIIGSTEFVKIFTDAANHIPRHRRTHFFTHLVDTLGEAFLAPVCALIIGKAANKVIRQQGEDLKSTLSLPLSVLALYPDDMELSALAEIVREGRRLLSHVVEPEHIEPTILNVASENEQSLQSASAAKRRAHALVISVGVALETFATTFAKSGDPSIELVVSALLDVISTSNGTGDDGDITEVKAAAQVSVNQALRAMPAVSFVAAVANMIETGQPGVQAEALRLFADRLPSVSDIVRESTPVTSTVTKIIFKIKQMLLTSSSTVIVASFDALKSIGMTLSRGEEPSMMECVPLLIAAIRDGKEAASALAVLPTLSVKLGPRIIPYFRDITDECVIILREGVKGKPAGSSAILADALETLKSLFKAIPTFWGNTELGKVFQLYLSYQASSVQSPSLDAFVRAVVKKAPTKVLLPSLSEMWTSLQTGEDEDLTSAYEGLFDLLRRSLRAGSRADVVEHLRPLFKMMLEAFELRSKAGDLDIHKVEAKTIGAFIELVTKLNETAFKPLFRRLFDWAFTDTGSDRKITFCHLYLAMLDYFKGLMTPYMSFLVLPFIGILDAFHTDTTIDAEIWTCVIETLTASLNVDEGLFWREDRLRQIASPLVAQVPKCVDLREDSDTGKAKVLDALVALAGTVSDDSQLKKINLDVLMHTRSEDARVRLFALQCAEALWSTHGTKLMGYVSETSTFIAECAEDENDSVVKATHKLKAAVEGATGERIDSL